MRGKNIVMSLFITIGLLLSAGCTTPQSLPPEPAQTAPATAAMTLEQAYAIAEQSSCMDVGDLTGEAFYNDSTGTWWFDLDAEREGCNPACIVTASDQTTEVNWRCTGALPPQEDEVDAVDEDAALIPDPAEARDAVVEFLGGQDLEFVPPSDVVWEKNDITETGTVGSTTYEYRYENWVIVVQYPIVNPTETIYRIGVTKSDGGYSWQGKVNASYVVIEAEMVEDAEIVTCWGGFIKSLPDDSQYDDYLMLGEDTGVGIEPAEGIVAGQIQVLKDSSTFVHVWGRLHCPAADYGGCYVEITQLREDKPGPLPDPAPISGWIGTIISFAEGAQHDDAFILSGNIPVMFGIESTDEGLAAELAGLRDTGQVIKIWGEVSCGVPSPNGALIMVTGLEMVESQE